MTENNKEGSGSKNKSLFLYFVLAFLITWVLYLPKVLADNNIVDMPGALVFLKNFAILGPFIAAFMLTLKASGWEGAKLLWKRGWDFKFDKKWLIPIFGLPALTMGLTVLGVNLLGGTIEWEHGAPLAFVVPLFFIIYLTNSLPEEYGWRGYALDRLQIRWNALTASLILGFLHGIWHLPLHFMSGTTQEIIPVPEFVLKTMVGAVIFTWIYNNTNRNVFLAILGHTVSNVFAAAIPYWTTSQGRWVSFAIDLTIVAIIVAIYGSKKLVREKKSLS